MQMPDIYSPALSYFDTTILQADLWRRPHLSARDRSIVTVAALIVRRDAQEMVSHFALALDHGVIPAELSEMIAHLAFYSGWGSGTLAASIIRQVFKQRGIGPEKLLDSAAAPLALDEDAEGLRAAIVNETVGPLFQGLVDYTTDVLFHDLWLRPSLAPRDRSLTTVAALIAAGQFPQITFHLNKAMDNGMTEEQAAEVITHLAFYAGWPNAMSSVAVAKAVFEKRRDG
jgi:4-carboxymuconolactone decarboxylase